MGANGLKEFQKNLSKVKNIFNVRGNILKLICVYIALFFNFSYVYADKFIITGPIGEKEFMDRSDIEEVVFEEGCGIREIPDYAFLGCSSLKKVILPEGVTRIGFQAFSECASLERITLPSTLQDIGSNSFAYCESLRDVVFPDSLIHIGHNAFSFCHALEEVYLPDSLQEIESYAFSDCGSLRRVRFPANDKMLGELILNCCHHMREIEEPSVLPPTFDCDSFIFDPSDDAAYKNCSLIVPDKSVPLYKKSRSWSLFYKDK